ncbi:hypothetical protein HELRODRAFT_178435 [Helobdella robusta]|uniref:Uncharacterized protein n=1 Tax=Helobdella robusta TaxID=6412 RepID=T1FD59_HELRO|nr:hypothetical protein HELRODRAFT_178435 [Helobdella robusta]ESN97002.1 hypothetical protein HELRODRAFT_178435 [Helobdella robusta]
MTNIIHNKEYFKRFYIQAVDAALEFLKTRFKSEGFLFAQNVKNSDLNALNLQDQDVKVLKLLKYYENDTNVDRLILHLKMFRDLICHGCSNSKGNPNYAKSERSFSALCSLKTNLRSTMGQEKLNHEERYCIATEP